MTEELWTPEEVADRWRMQKRTVMDMLRRGELKAFKVGRIWRIYYSDVLRYEKDRVNDKRMNPPEVAAMPRPVIRRIV